MAPDRILQIARDNSPKGKLCPGRVHESGDIQTMERKDPLLKEYKKVKKYAYSK
jgi:hypothetical protein